LRQNVDNLGPTPVPERLCDGREGVEKCVFRLPIAHSIKISLEYLSINRTAKSKKSNPPFGRV